MGPVGRMGHLYPEGSVRFHEPAEPVQMQRPPCPVVTAAEE